MNESDIKDLILTGLFAGGGLGAVWLSFKAAVAYLARMREKRMDEGRADAKDWGLTYKNLYEETKAQLDAQNPILEELRARVFSAEERAHKASLEATELRQRVDELMEKNRRLSKLLEEKETMLRSRKPSGDLT